jgi:formamidase
MQDMVNGEYRLPWEDQVEVIDGTSCGFAPPEREYAGNILGTSRSVVKAVG